MRFLKSFPHSCSWLSTLLSDLISTGTTGKARGKQEVIRQSLAKAC